MTTFEEQKTQAMYLENWLCKYTTEVITKVVANLDSILSTESTMYLLKELYEREQEEKEERLRSFRGIVNANDINDVEGISIAIKLIHNNCLTHSSSYRDVLYDMYIK